MEICHIESVDRILACNHTRSGRLSGSPTCVVMRRIRLLTAPVVLTTTTDFHHARFLCILAVFTTILTALFSRTIACGMLTFVIFLVFRHWKLLAAPESLVGQYRPQKPRLRHRTHNDRSLPFAQIQVHRFVQLDRMFFAVNTDDQI